MTYSATGIVLRRQDAHEWDRFYTIYTREHGKLFLVGKGTRRPRAKLAAHVEPLHEAELEIAHGRQIDRIIFARTLRTNEAFAQSHAHFTHASFLCECVDALTKSNHQDPAIFDLLQVALLAVRDAHPALAPAFIVRLIALLGYAPDLRQCIECRTPFRDRPATALPHRGGASCLPCSSPASRGGVRGGAGMYPPPLPGGELEGVRSGVDGRGSALRSFSEAGVGAWMDAIPLSPHDRSLIDLASQTFGPHPLTPAVQWFARGLLEAHLVYPMRTSLTGAAAHGMMRVS